MNKEYKKMLERFEQICQNAKKELYVKKEKEQEKNFIEKIDKGLTISEYDEIEYWLANVEVLDNTDYILNNRKAKILVRYLKEKQQEIDRLNKECDTYMKIATKRGNIINKLEKYIKENYVIDEPIKFKNDLLDILQGSDKELKEEDNK